MQILHLVLAWSRVLSYMLLVGDLAAIVFLATRAYVDGEWICVELDGADDLWQQARWIVGKCHSSGALPAHLLMPSDLMLEVFPKPSEGHYIKVVAKKCRLSTCTRRLD